jgi:hypothetical protein
VALLFVKLPTTGDRSLATSGWFTLAVSAAVEAGRRSRGFF